VPINLVIEPDGNGHYRLNLAEKSVDCEDQYAKFLENRKRGNIVYISSGMSALENIRSSGSSYEPPQQSNNDLETPSRKDNKGKSGSGKGKKRPFDDKSRIIRPTDRA
jgi:hypothetical protein